LNDTLCRESPLLDLAARQPAMPRSARATIAMLEKIAGGRLTLHLPDGSERHFGEAGAPAASFTVHDWSVFDDALARGDVGFGEAYVDGCWDSPDPAALLTLLVNNREAIADALHGQWVALVGARLKHRFNANTRDGSRRNIMAHYDLGNDFYARWLDETMSYSAALFSDASQRDLAEAQRAKYRRILRRLDIRPGQHILEIGCGWGGFAEVAAAEYGARVTGVTLSPAQLEFATRRIVAAGLSERVELRLQDYRDLGGQFDAIVSIEMFEAVGEAYWPVYFATLQALLPPGGRAVVQSITMGEAHYDSYRKGTDFIQQHVFPGGMLPSKSLFIRGAWDKGLMVRDAFAFGADYAKTLAIWATRFEQAWPAIAGRNSAGKDFDERFRRLWRFYLAYCEAGFSSGQTDVVQFELERAS
jgi:cyclopropane-fatty-acyl-phospholipid synthase